MNSHAGWDRSGRYCIACGDSDTDRDCNENLAKGRRYVSDEAFWDFIAASGLDEFAISSATGASRPTVRRWLARMGAPHMFGRQGMINLIKKAGETS